MGHHKDIPSGLSTQATKERELEVFKGRVNFQRKLTVPAMLVSWGMLIAGIAVLGKVSPFGIDALFHQPALLTAMPWTGWLAIGLVMVGTVAGVTSMTAFLASDAKEEALHNQVQALKTPPQASVERSSAFIEEAEESYVDAAGRAEGEPGRFEVEEMDADEEEGDGEGRAPH